MNSRLYVAPIYRSLGVLFVLVVVTPCAGATPALTIPFTAGNATNNETQTQGWDFTPNTSIEVTALGVFDSDSNGLSDPHEVGLWDDSGVLLRSATVGTGSGPTLSGPFRYVDISPVALNAGTKYVIGALYLGIRGGGTLDPTPASQDFWSVLDVGVADFSHSIAFGDPRISSQQGDSLEFPTVMSLAGQGPLVGPNFLFVPEPTLMAQLWIGVMGATIFRCSTRRRKRERETV